MKKILLPALIPLLILIFFTTCKKDNSTVANKTKVVAAPDVDLATAITIARTFTVPPSYKAAPPINGQKVTVKADPSSMTDAIDFTQKSVENYFTVKDHDGSASMYVINFKGGGFVVVSASTREHPVLSYSDNSTFPEEITKSNHPINYWISSERIKIRALKSNTYKSKDSLLIQSEWNRLTPVHVASTNPKFVADVPYCPNGHWDTKSGQCVSCASGYTWDGSVCQPPPPCQVAYQVGPLVQTHWTQNCGYNMYTPTDNESAYCNHMPTGCESVAIAQILKFWHYGEVWAATGVNGTHGYQIYNYSDASMPLYTSSTEIARLMRDIGTNVGMSYDTEANGGSGASVNHHTFFTMSGFASPCTENSYSTNDILGEISYGRPCLLGGFDYAFLPWNEQGHEWVCDGLHAIPNTCYPTYWAGYTVTAHLNWGWGGTCDGWYTPGSWVPVYSNGSLEGDRFLQHESEVTNIWLGNEYPTGTN